MTIEDNANQISVEDLKNLEDAVIGIVEPLAGIANERDGFAPKVSDEVAEMIRESIIRALAVQEKIVELEARIDELQAIFSRDRIERIKESKEFWQTNQRKIK